jgi:hypothetical protein
MPMPLLFFTPLLYRTMMFMIHVAPAHCSPTEHRQETQQQDSRTVARLPFFVGPTGEGLRP